MRPLHLFAALFSLGCLTCGLAAAAERPAPRITVVITPASPPAELPNTATIDPSTGMLTLTPGTTVLPRQQFTLRVLAKETAPFPMVVDQKDPSRYAMVYTPGRGAVPLITTAPMLPQVAPLQPQLVPVK